MLIMKASQLDFLLGHYILDIPPPHNVMILVKDIPDQLLWGGSQSLSVRTLNMQRIRITEIKGAVIVFGGKLSDFVFTNYK
jgi:hypothetical protein